MLTGDIGKMPEGSESGRGGAFGFEGQQEGWCAESILGEELRAWKYEERDHCSSLGLGLSQEASFGGCE